MDEKTLELAETLILATVQTGIDNVRRQIPKQPADFDGLCFECGEPVGEGRIKFGAVTCIDCQTHIEARAAQYKTTGRIEEDE